MYKCSGHNVFEHFVGKVTTVEMLDKKDRVTKVVYLCDSCLDDLQKTDLTGLDWGWRLKKS